MPGKITTLIGCLLEIIYTKQGADRAYLIDMGQFLGVWMTLSEVIWMRGLRQTTKGPVESSQSSQSYRLMLTSLPHQLQPAASLGRNPHHYLFWRPSTNSVCQRSPRGGKALAGTSQWGPLLQTWCFRHPRGVRCNREVHSTALSLTGLSKLCTIGERISPETIV